LARNVPTADADQERVDRFDLWQVRYGRIGAELWQLALNSAGLQALSILRAVMRVETRAYHADFPAPILLSVARSLRRK
jgi:hypothetical protein